MYRKEILQKLVDIIPQATAISIQEALYSNDAQRLQKEMHRLLLQSASCYDTAGNFSGDKLKQLSETALAQIQDRKYDTDMILKGIKTIYKYGVAFSGKQVEIAAASQ